MIAEDPVEAEVKSSTEQQDVEEDTEDENLLRYSDEVIIHPGSQSAGSAGKRMTAVQWRDPDLAGADRSSLTITKLPLLSSCFPLLPALVSFLSSLISTTLLDLSS